MSILQRGSVSQMVLSECNNRYPATTSVSAELKFTPGCRNDAPFKLWFFLSLYVLKSIDDDYYECRIKYADIHLMSFFWVTKFKYVCMKFRITELLDRDSSWLSCKLESHFLFVIHEICLINHNINKSLYFKQLNSFLVRSISTHRSEL